jgi:hypothetical protein
MDTNHSSIEIISEETSEYSGRNSRSGWSVLGLLRSYRKLFFGVLTLLGVTGLTAMAAFLLNVVNTAANFFSKKQEKKPRLLLYFKNPKSSSLYEMRLLRNRNDRRQGIRKDYNLQMHRMRVNK